MSLDGDAMPKTTLNEADVLIGTRLRTRRLEMGLSQVALANRVGITFQQVQKYETGRNRIAASRLAHIANVLGVPAGYFLGEDQYYGGVDEMVSLMATPGAIELLRAFSRVKDSAARKAMLNVVYALAATSTDVSAEQEG